ncbi:MAG: hypothetical protein OJF55_001179 [Rhodanobacteraceae bacterium]|nr:MAG: hypothetical protein OJF55_001179 [Rhodanobacteraceae bacterium]
MQKPPRGRLLRFSCDGGSARPICERRREYSRHPWRSPFGPSASCLRTEPSTGYHFAARN